MNEEEVINENIAQATIEDVSDTISSEGPDTSDVEEHSQDYISNIVNYEVNPNDPNQYLTYITDTSYSDPNSPSDHYIQTIPIYHVQASNDSLHDMTSIEEMSSAQLVNNIPLDNNATSETLLNSDVVSEYAVPEINYFPSEDVYVELETTLEADYVPSEDNYSEPSSTEINSENPSVNMSQQENIDIFKENLANFEYDIPESLSISLLNIVNELFYKQSNEDLITISKDNLSELLALIYILISD